MKTLIKGLSLALFSCLISGCTNTEVLSAKTPPDDIPLIKQVIGEVESNYAPIPEKYRESIEYEEIGGRYRIGDFTNAIVRKILDYDVEIVEHKFDDSHVYAVSIRCILPNDPIPDISHDEVEKIVYGYSINDGLLIEDPRDIELIITSIKTQSVKEHENDIYLPMGDTDKSQVLTTEWRHGCRLAIRLILKNGEIKGTHGHIDERDWNPKVADLFLNAIKSGRTTCIGDVDLETLMPTND